MRQISLCLLCLLVCSACYYPQRVREYEIGYNFLVTADSLLLCTNMPRHVESQQKNSDTLVVRCGAPLVVAQLEIIPEDSVDSVWIKVATNQWTQGWLHESQLLPGVVPDDPISQFINLFSDLHLLLVLGLSFIALSGWLLRSFRSRRFPMVHVDDIASPYPLLLCLTLSSSSVLFASMRHFVPEIWEHFYFHPTLNPFGLSPMLALFLSSVWLMLLFFGAALLDIRRNLNLTEAILYTLSLVAVLGLLHIVFSLLTPYYLGYPLLLVYFFMAIRQYILRHRAHYICGRCGASMHSLGRCPRCYTDNALPREKNITK